MRRTLGFAAGTLLLLMWTSTAAAAPTDPVIDELGFPEDCYGTMRQGQPLQAHMNMCLSVTRYEIVVGVFREDDHCVLGLTIPLY